MQRGSIFRNFLTLRYFFFSLFFFRIVVDDKGCTLIVVFGVLFSHEDDPLRGVRAAIEMKDQINYLKLSCSIGVTTGKGSDFKYVKTIFC